MVAAGGAAPGGFVRYECTSYNFIGMVGECFPQGQDWHVRAFLGTAAGVTGGRVCGFAAGTYTFSV